MKELGFEIFSQYNFFADKYSEIRYLSIQPLPSIPSLVPMKTFIPFNCGLPAILSRSYLSYMSWASASIVDPIPEWKFSEVFFSFPTNLHRSFLLIF